MKIVWLGFLIGLLAGLAGCGGGGGNSATPPAGATTSTPRVGAAQTAAPQRAPTQQLTPPGLPSGGFPLLDAPLDGQIVYSNGDGDIYVVEPRPKAASQKVLGAPNNKGYLGEPAWSPDGQQIIYTYLFPFDATGLPTQDVLIANADGRNPQTVLAHTLSGEFFQSPVFATDGRAIYYAHTMPIYKVGLSLEQVAW